MVFDIGVAMGKGTDAAFPESADVVLMKGQLFTARQPYQDFQRLVGYHENLFLALFTMYWVSPIAFVLYPSSVYGSTPCSSPGL